MEANDFRIGNLLEYCGQTIIVLGTSRTEIECGYFEDSIGFYRSWSEQEIKPIPLTEEWLLKFGFESDPYSDTYKIGSLTFNIDLTKGTFDFWCENVTGQIMFIKYVHQLQNLIFALTGEELSLTKQ